MSITLLAPFTIPAPVTLAVQAGHLEIGDAIVDVIDGGFQPYLVTYVIHGAKVTVTLDTGEQRVLSPHESVQLVIGS